MVAAAAIAIGFAHYLQYFVDVPTRLGAIGLLAVETGVALTGIRRSARLSLSLSALQVLGLLAVVVIGLPHVGGTSLLEGTDVGGVLGATALVFFAFIGFDEVITLAEETGDPTRVVPRALLAALGISAALYVAVAIAAVSVLGADRLAGSSRPLTDVIAHVAGGRAEGAVAVIALVSTLNTSLLALTAGSRLVFGMASAGALPRWLETVAPRTGAPRPAIVVTAVGAVGCTLLGSIALVASVTDFAVYVVFLAVNATVIVLRRRAPSRARPFRVPVSLGGVPVPAVLGFLAAAAMLPQLEPRSASVGMAFVAAGALVHALYGRHRQWEPNDPGADDAGG
jgi:APA family basic amino acid/polyamine antiporter